MDQVLRTAIEKAGGVAALASALKISSQAISQWDRVPPRRVVEVEKITGVSRHDLRPDIFGEAA
jgi:DNA-binding transcriptional regulator YdaS (Cro superfamily)